MPASRRACSRRGRGWPPRWLFGVALVLFGLAMLVAHMRQPVVTGRYLLTFQVGVIAVVACLAAEAVRHRRVLFVLLIVVALYGIVEQTLKTIGERRWDSTAGVVSQWIGECRSSPVYATFMPQMVRLRNAQAAIRWGYEWQGQRYGFQVRHLEPGGTSLPPITGPCPALLWVEQMGSPAPPSAEAALLRLGRSANVDVSAARLFVGESGFVLKLPPRP